MRIVDHINVVRPELLFRDGAAFLEAKQVLRDNAEKMRAPGSGVRLRTHGPVTYSGMITNRRVYPGARVRKAVDTWMSPFPKPIHRHHNSGRGDGPTEDPIGRAFSARYVQTADNEAWNTDGHSPLPFGTGFIDLTFDVTDPDAVQKVLDGRFLTLSVGFDTKSMFCSVCGTDWLQADHPCDHAPGVPFEITEAKRTRVVIPHLITGDLVYDEASFVNRPANPLASIVGYQLLADALKDSMPWDIKDAPVKFEELELCGKLYQICEPKDKESIAVSTMSDEEFAEMHLIDGMVEAGIVDLEGVQEYGYKQEHIDKKEGILLKAPHNDAKLSTEQRKKLKGSTFCGPDRSFPVPDCAHYTAALRLLGRAKLSSDQKARVRACIERRGKSLDCPGAKSGDEASCCPSCTAGAPCESEKKTKEDAAQAPPASSNNTVSEGVVNISSSSDSLPLVGANIGGEKTMPTQQTDNKAEVKTDAAVAAPAPQVDASAAELAIVKAQLESATAVIDAAKDEIKALRDENTKLAGEIVKGLAKRLLDLRIQLGLPNAVAASTDSAKYEESASELAKRTRPSLEDAIKDLTEWVSAKPKTPAQNIQRGSVTQADAGVEVDTSRDDPKADTGQSKKADPSQYKSGLAARLKALNERS